MWRHPPSSSNVFSSILGFIDNPVGKQELVKTVSDKMKVVFITQAQKQCMLQSTNISIALGTMEGINATLP